MRNERRQILDMLKEGKISVSEAEELLMAVESSTADEVPEADDSESKKNLKYLRVTVEPEGNQEGKRERVNVRVPLALLRAGAKFQSLLPVEARDKVESSLKEKGIDIGALTTESIEALIEALGEMSIDIDAEDKKVRIFCE